VSTSSYILSSRILTLCSKLLQVYAHGNRLEPPLAAFTVADPAVPLPVMLCRTQLAAGIVAAYITSSLCLCIEHSMNRRSVQHASNATALSIKSKRTQTSLASFRARLFQPNQHHRNNCTKTQPLFSLVITGSLLSFLLVVHSCACRKTLSDSTFTLCHCLFPIIPLHTLIPHHDQLYILEAC
jgi:hypothetical protein